MEDILTKDVREAGGILTMEDLRNHKVVITDANDFECDGIHHIRDIHLLHVIYCTNYKNTSFVYIHILYIIEIKLHHIRLTLSI